MENKTWYASLALVLLLGAIACPKVKPGGGGGPSSAPATQPIADKFEKCYGQDWTSPNQIEPQLRVSCNDPVEPFEEKIQGCFTYDWAKDTLSDEQRALCAKVGFKARVKSCREYNWSLPDEINPEDRSFCKRLGFRDVVDPEICEKQDWTKPAELPPLIRKQCEKISLIPKCDPKKKSNVACVPAEKVLFDHAEHGVDLPAKKADKELLFERKKEVVVHGKKYPKTEKHVITCADCHREQAPDKKSKKPSTGVDINRPDHASCSGITGCHSDMASNQTMCDSCHLEKQAPKLKAYGANAVVEGQQYGFDFDHRSHTNPDGIMKKNGLPPVKCTECHSLEVTKDKSTSGTKMTQAGHKQCAQCHFDERNRIKMNDCLSCHNKDSAENEQSGHAYLDSRPHAQEFKHITHEKDAANAPQKCELCHISVAETTSLSAIAVPPMLGCLQSCHSGEHVNDPRPAFDGWVECSKCHSEPPPPSVTPKNFKKK